MNQHQGGLIAIGVLAVLFGGDLVSLLGGLKSAPGSDGQAEVQQECPLAALSEGGRVHIAYCTSWGMRGAFMQVKQFVEESFPGTEVLGSTYPVAAYKVALSKAVVACQITLAAVMLAGDQIFQALHMQPPSLYLQLREKKMGVLVGIWFLGNMLHNSLTSTGAFEVFSNGEQVFSKLETQRMPSIEELVSGLRRTLTPGDH